MLEWLPKIPLETTGTEVLEDLIFSVEKLK